MTAKKTIATNNFLEILADAAVLYNLAKSTKDDFIENTLSKASILSSNYALEAAANSCVKTIEVTKSVYDNIERFNTLDKFDFVLQWHTQKILPRDKKYVAAVKHMIQLRNSFVHPKIKKQMGEFASSLTKDNKPIHIATPYTPQVTPSGIDPELILTADAAKYALKNTIQFLNSYVEEWGLDPSACEEVFLPKIIESNTPIYNTKGTINLISTCETIKVKVKFLPIYDIYNSVKDEDINSILTSRCT